MGLYGPETSVAAACGLSSCGSQAPEKGSILEVQGFRCSEAFAIFSDQGLYLYWQACSLPLSHQGSPQLKKKKSTLISPLFNVFGSSSSDSIQLIQLIMPTLGILLS